MIDPTQTYWFPMRVTYGRELAVKEHLDKERIECFLPMRYEIIDHNGQRERKLVPAVSNLIFVRSTVDILNDKKHYDNHCAPLRYMMRDSTYDSLHEIMTVSDGAMNNFMKVAKTPDDKVFYLDPGDYVNNHIVTTDFTKQIDDEISYLKLDTKVRREFMLMEARLLDERREGIAEGKEIGLAEGEAIGLVKGEAEHKLKVAKLMLAKGCYSLQEITELSGLSLADVEKLKEEA